MDAFQVSISASVETGKIWSFELGHLDRIQHLKSFLTKFRVVLANYLLLFTFFKITFKLVVFSPNRR